MVVVSARCAGVSPIAVTVPVEVIVGRASAPTLAGTLAAALVLVVLSRAFWNRAVRSYSGASA